MKKILLVILTFICLGSIQAQEPYTDKGFVILLSTKDYSVALRAVRVASRQLDVKVDLRDYVEGADFGLQLAEVDPSEEEMNLYEYIPRGRWDDGVYLSIEYSDYFEGFTKGYYIVVLASGPVNEILYNAVEDAFSFYPDVYIKKASVYMGSMY